MKSGIFQFEDEVVLNGRSIKDRKKKAELVYLLGLNYISRRYNQKRNELTKLIYLTKIDILKQIFFVVSLIGIAIVASIFGGLIGIATSIPIALIGLVFLVKKIELYSEELNDYKKEKEELQYDLRVNSIKKLQMPVYLNKINNKELIISDASNVFERTNFIFQNMNDKDIVSSGFDEFKDKFDYLNNFMLMPSKKDYKNILKKQKNQKAIRKKLLETMLNPSFNKIKDAFAENNITEKEIDLNAVKSSTQLADDIKNVFLQSRRVKVTNDLISELQSKRNQDWLVYQSVNELNGLIKDLQDWIGTIIKSSLPRYLKKNKKDISEKLGFHNKKLKNLSKFVENTFHKDIELFQGFNSFQFCENCGSTNFDDIVEKTNIKSFVERTLLNNASKDDILDLKQAPKIVHGLLKNNTQKIQTKFMNLPVFEKINDTDWSDDINAKSYPRVIADYKLMKREKDERGNYVYTCPNCEKSDVIQVNRLIEPIAHSYLANMQVLRERMEKEKSTFIRNIHDVILAKEEKELNIGQYELAYLEAKQKISDLKMQIKISDEIISELKRS